MKKSYGLYAVGWAILLVLFNVIAIVFPGLPTLEKTTPSFWIGYAFINASLFGQLICAWFAFKEENAKKTFYNISMFTIGYAGMISMFIVGILCMLIAPLPYWVGGIICPIILAINAISVIKAKVAIDIVARVDDKVTNSTSFIYTMREESESLFTRAGEGDVKSVCKKVRDAFKFSDPMSNAALESVEFEINNMFNLFKKAVYEGKADVVTMTSAELLSLIQERNNKCKLTK